MNIFLILLYLFGRGKKQMNQELFKDLLLKRSQDTPDQIIYILTDNINHRLTYSALLEQSTALALSLQAPDFDGIRLHL